MSGRQASVTLARAAGGRLPQCLAWGVALCPLLCVHAAWLASSWLELIDWCNPYWEGCTSISRASRQPPVVHYYRLLMLPWGVAMMLYWGLCAAWLARLHPAAVWRRRVMLACGVAGAAFYLLYLTHLGETGETPRLLRRYGINLYFSLTVLAQMWLISAVVAAGALSAGLRRAFVGLLAALLLVGFGSLPLQFGDFADKDRWVNILEWHYALMMVACYPLTALAFAHTGFRLQARWLLRAGAGPGQGRHAGARRGLSCRRRSCGR